MSILWLVPLVFLIAVVHETKRPATLWGRIVLVAVQGSDRFGDVVAWIGYRELAGVATFGAEVVAELARLEVGVSGCHRGRDFRGPYV